MDRQSSPTPQPQGPGDGYVIIAYLLSGMILWGGVGWLLDRWLGTGFLLLIGLLIGAAASVYLVYVRFGR
ncbi:MAG: AtpZ/AtpI family protein [Sporichthyaceae bacterium]|nr:AtpZ/AtpI family protein [Sporichthyaceae bacterium]